MTAFHDETLVTTYLNQSDEVSSLETSFKQMKKFCGVVSIFEHKLSFDALLDVEIPVVRLELKQLCDYRKWVTGTPLQRKEIKSPPPDGSGNGIHLSKTITQTSQVPFLRLEPTTEICEGSNGRLLVYKHTSGIQIIRKSISKEKPNSMAEVKATVQLQHIQDISPKVYFILETKETYDMFMEHICPCSNILLVKINGTIQLKIIDFGNGAEIPDVTNAHINKDIIGIYNVKSLLLSSFPEIDFGLGEFTRTNQGLLSLEKVEELQKKACQLSKKFANDSVANSIIVNLIVERQTAVSLRHGLTEGEDERQKDQEDKCILSL